MKPETLRRSIKDAQRFIECVRKVDVKDRYFGIIGNRYSAACKRASLDLTRTLADLRQGR